MKLAAVIPTLGERPELAPLITQLVKENVAVSVMARPGENLYKMWNEGAKWAKSQKAAAVAILNDDIKLPPKTIQIMYEQLLAGGYDCVGVDPRAKFGVSNKLETTEITGWVGKLMEEITGWCFMVKTGKWQTIDEGYEWWWGNGDLFLKISQKGGKLGQIKGLGIDHAGEGTARNHAWTKAAKIRDASRWRKLH
ncbi:MAG: glycosyltransferase [Candidatus Saccharimonadales bacterium]